MIKTKKGSVIKRFKEVGKKMGNDLYFHKDYVLEYIDINFYNKMKSYLPNNFNFNILKYNIKDESISFINSPDFDVSDEPIVSDSYKIRKDGNITLTKEKKSPQIYHHKWLFVKDDYNGFNTYESIERSKMWLDISDKINMSKIGYKSYWSKCVLPLLDDELWNVNNQEYNSSKTSIKHIPSPTKLIIKNAIFKKGMINLDIGGGKYDDMTDYFNKHGIKNYVFDPFNRSYEHNKRVIDLTKDGKSDSVTIFNVLNVIKERRNQIKVLKQAENAVKKDGKIYIYSNYYIKGKKARIIENRNSYQHNYRLKDILPIVKSIFPNSYVDKRINCIISMK